MMAKFEARCKDAAAWIRNGGLKDDDPTVSQVDADVHALLADINELGMVTMDSQSGADETERAYVGGFMRPDVADRFVERFNCATDAMCFKLLPTNLTRRALHDLSNQKADPIMRSYVPVTRSSKKQPRSATRVPLYMPAREHAFLQTASGYAGIAAGENVVLVYCVDPVWGRKATPRRGLIQQVRLVLRQVVSA